MGSGKRPEPGWPTRTGNGAGAASESERQTAALIDAGCSLLFPGYLLTQALSEILVLTFHLFVEAPHVIQ
jgi:hypothetical protein